MFLFIDITQIVVHALHSCADCMELAQNNLPFTMPIDKLIYLYIAFHAEGSVPKSTSVRETPVVLIESMHTNGTERKTNL